MQKLEQYEQSTKAAESGADAGLTAIRDQIHRHPSKFIRALGERLFLIGTDVQLFSDPHARADLLALDRQGTAVAVVVEREGEHSLLEHGLMCAGLVAGWKTEFFFRYPTPHPTSRLPRFLRVPEAEVNSKQRVILVARSHDYAVYGAAQFLAKRHGIEIWCVRGEIDAATGRLLLARIGPESFESQGPVETVRIVYPRASAPPDGDLRGRDLGLPHEPMLGPPSAGGTEIGRMQAVWRPSAQAAASSTIEDRLQQIIDEEPRDKAEPAAPAGSPAESDSPAASLLQAEEPAVAPAEAEPPVAAEAEPPARTPAETETPAVAETEPPAAEAGPQLVARAETRKKPAPRPGSAVTRGFQAREIPRVRPAPAKPSKTRHWFTRVLRGALVTALAAAGLLVVGVRRPSPVSGRQPLPEIPPATPIFESIVRDASTRHPIAGASLYYAGKSMRAGQSGEFRVEVNGGDRTLLVKAPGYRQKELSIDSRGPIDLEPIVVRGFYVAHSHVADPFRRDDILELIRGTSSNAVVLGVKDVTGKLNVAVNHPIALETQAAAGAETVNLARQVAAWKAEGIYTIALVAVFKDDLLARSKPYLALRGILSGRAVIDHDNIAWTDPSSPPVRDYNIAVAKAAARAGFDEVQFDFIRYPAEGLSLEGGSQAEYQRRLSMLASFLRSAQEALAPHNVYLSASVFGSVCVIPRVSVIGQKIEEFAEYVDYVSPMLYPSYFEPGQRYPIPLRHSYQLVYDNLMRASLRLEGNSRRLRPWLQNFPDRASPNQPLEAESIRRQVQGAEDARTSGWMLWDARNRYQNTLEAISELESERGQAHNAVPDDISGGMLLRAAFFDDGPPSSPRDERLRLVGLLLLAGGCLAMLYASVRAAWMFHQWNRHHPTPQPNTKPAPSAVARWLARHPVRGRVLQPRER